MPFFTKDLVKPHAINLILTNFASFIKLNHLFMYEILLTTLAIDFIKRVSFNYSY